MSLAPGNSIRILPDEPNLWIFGCVTPNLSIRFLRTSKAEIIDETDHFQNYFYKLSIPSTTKDQETVIDFNKNFFNKLSLSYFEFIKKNNVDDLIDPFINFDRKYKN